MGVKAWPQDEHPALACPALGPAGIAHYGRAYLTEKEGRSGLSAHDGQLEPRIGLDSL